MKPGQKKQLDYARHREWARLQDRNKDEARLLQQLRDLIEAAADEIKTQADAWFARYGSSEGLSPGEVKKRAREADILELQRKAKRYVKRRKDSDFAFSKKANAEMKLYNFTMKVSRQELLYRHCELILNELGDELEQGITRHLEKMTKDELIFQASILGQSVPDIEEFTADAKMIAGWSFAGAKFSDRIWNELDELKKRLYQGIQKSILLGKHPTTWMRSLEDILRSTVQNTHYAMKRIAVTETARAQIQAQKLSYERAGIRRYMVVCEPTACEICMPHDGKGYKVSDMVQGVNSPVFHPNCKCSTSAYVSEDTISDYVGDSVKQLQIEGHQFGKKAGKHMADFDLSPTKSEDRDRFRAYIEKIVYNSDEVRLIDNWRGQEAGVLAHIKGEDVVLTTSEGKFITILKGGINNARIKNKGKE